MKTNLKRLFSWTRSAGLLGVACALMAGLSAAGQPGGDIRSVAQMVYGVPGGGTPSQVNDLMGIPRVPNLIDLADFVVQNPDVVNEAGKLGLQVTDGAADGLDAIQDSKLYIPVDATTGVIEKLSEGIAEALKRGEKIGDLLDKYKDQIKGAGDKIKLLGTVLKVIKAAHLTGHVIESLYSGDRTKFEESLNNAVKEGLKMGGGELGGWGGTAGGAAIGGFIGGWFGGVGAVPGAIIGGAVGGWLGGKTGEAGAEYINDNYVKDGTKGLADWIFDSLYGAPQAPPALPPPLSGGGGGGGGGGGQRRPRPAPQLNRFR